ncbi:MAG: 3-phosphoshikimate 1-carboxyvinyltransferase [Actinobacteria bacterium]|nr:3-phosphoshikimate 1-carboxyvinyltransferase [Actinomycetota bacterium]
MTMTEHLASTRFLSLDGGLRGTLRVPGDKSVSHRAVLLGAVNEGPLSVSGFLRSADTMASVSAVRDLGVEVEEHGEGLIIHGRGWGGLSEPANVIDVANSGTLIRLLPGLLASLPFFCVLTGDASIRRRPMARILRPLAAMGASVCGRRDNTLPPISIRGGDLHAIRHEMRVASAQVKSCVLLAGLRAAGPTTVVEPAASRDHTERMIRYAGGRVDREVLPDGRGAVTVWPLETFHIDSVFVPGDFSSAAFFLVAALLAPGSVITLDNVGLNPTRTALLDVLRRMGADIEVTQTQLLGPEPVGRIVARSSSLVATTVESSEVPNLIDELPLFLLAAARAQGWSHLRGAAELRAKESDRLRVMAGILAGLGVQVNELPDGMDVLGTPSPWRAGTVAAESDHRMAMVGAIAGLVSREGVTVDDTHCIAVSFPGFMSTLRDLGAVWLEAPR